MEPNEPSVFETTWIGLRLDARIALLTLVAEQAARHHGIIDEVQPIDHGWMVVEQVAGAEQLITADAFAAITNNADERTPPGFTEAVRVGAPLGHEGIMEGFVGDDITSSPPRRRGSRHYRCGQSDPPLEAFCSVRSARHCCACRFIDK